MTDDRRDDEIHEEMREEIRDEMRDAMRREMGWHYVPRAVKFLTIALMCALVLLLVGWVAMLLWNWLLPGLFGFKTITYWQAVGLMFLSRLLFGGFRGGPRGGGWRRDRKLRHRMFARWERMTPEERERFRKGMYGRGGPASADQGGNG